MTLSAFAHELAARLTDLLPGGFIARVEGDTVHIESPDGMGSAASLGHIDPEEADPDDFASAAWNVLSMAQDVVNETSGDPWPVALGEKTDLAEPGTRADGRTVHLWFGAEDQPALRLPPITLDA
jgi:hypothetical protein